MAEEKKTSKDHHLPGGGFTNPWTSFEEQKHAKLMARELRKVDTSEANLPPMTEPNWNDIRSPNPEKVQVTWIGHASFLIQMDGINIVTDPVFSERCSPTQMFGPKRIRPVPFPEADLPDIDIVIISHNHYDHLDTNTVQNLKDKVKEWYVPLGVAAWFKDMKIENVIELDWWDEHQSKVENTTVVCTPCQHFSGRSLWDKCMTLWSSWVIIGKSHRIYFAGDTGYKTVQTDDLENDPNLPTCPAFKEIGSKYGPFDLACIPIGAYCPRPSLSNVHLSPDDAVLVHQDVQSKQSIAMHWGTFVLSAEPILEPLEKLAKALAKEKIPEEQFVALKHGETRIFN